MSSQQLYFFTCIVDFSGSIIKNIVVPPSQKSDNPANLYDYFETEDNWQLEDFLNEVIDKITPVAKTIYVKDNGSKVAFHLMGSVIKEGILIIGGDTVDSIGSKIFEEMLIINNEQSNQIRHLNKTIAGLKSKNEDINLELYTQLSETNNELVNTQRKLSKKNAELQSAMKEIELLSKMIPICSSCKSIRNDEGFWQNVESFLSSRSQIIFSHSICPDCIKKLYPEFADKKDSKEKKEV